MADIGQIHPAGAQDGQIQQARSGARSHPGSTRPFRQSGLAPDMPVKTDQGLIAAKDITPSHRVLTLKHGFRPVLWAGRDLCRYTNTKGAAPIRLGPEFSTRIHAGGKLMFAPGQHLLLRDARNELLFNSNEVLVRASDLVPFCGITEARQRYAVNWVQLLFDRMEIIHAGGIWVESMVPDMAALRQNKWSLATRIGTQIPQLRYEKARAAYTRSLPVLNRQEMRIWMCKEPDVRADCPGRSRDSCPLEWL